MRQLVADIANAVGAVTMSEQALNTAFDRGWEDLVEALDGVRARAKERKEKAAREPKPTVEEMLKEVLDILHDEQRARASAGTRTIYSGSLSEVDMAAFGRAAGQGEDRALIRGDRALIQKALGELRTVYGTEQRGEEGDQGPAEV